MRGHRGARQPDGARHVAHRRARGRLRPAGDVQHGGRRGRGRGSPTCGTRTTAPASACCAREAPVDAIRWFDVDPCYVFHPLNAYDDGDRVVLDVVRHPKMFATDLRGPNDGAPTLWRWIVDLTAGQVKEEQLDDLAVEFPRVDERVVGRRAPLGAHEPGAPRRRGSTSRHRVGGRRHRPLRPRQRAREVHDVGRGHGAGEAVFIAPQRRRRGGRRLGHGLRLRRRRGHHRPRDPRRRRPHR